MEAKGEVNLPDAATIKSICDWERHRALAGRWLRLNAMGEGRKRNGQPRGLTPMEMLMFSREVARASTEMDKAIRLLRLERDKVLDAWTALDQPSEARGARLLPARPAEPTQSAEPQEEATDAQ